MSLFSLCLTYTLICQTRLTAPDPGRISQQARRHTGRTIFSHPESRHRPMQSSTLICLPCVSLSISPPFIFYVLPLTPSLHLCHFPSLLLLPFISPSLESFLLYHCRAPRCFSPPRVSLFSFLPPETLLSPCLFVLFSTLLSLSSIFRPGFYFFF